MGGITCARGLEIVRDRVGICQHFDAHDSSVLPMRSYVAGFSWCPPN